jgi:hypothetical protein
MHRAKRRCSTLNGVNACGDRATLLVWALASVLVACGTTENSGPELTGVMPDVVSTRLQTTATLSGNNLFNNFVSLDLDDENPVVVDDAFELAIDGMVMTQDAVRAIDSRTMEIVIPAGLEVGSHDISLTIPDGRFAPLTDAFSVLDCVEGTCTDVCGDDMCSGMETPINCSDDCEWWDVNWSHRMLLSFDNSARNEDLAYFPVLVRLDPTMVDYSVMQDYGQDLRFVDDDKTTELSYEIESWNAAGPSYVWVQVPQIDGASSIDHIWMYYGNSAASAPQNFSTVWTNGYASVWHLSENSPDSFQDSSGNGNMLASNGGIGTSQLVDGQVSGSLHLDGSDDYLSGSNSSSLDIVGDMTLMAWVYVDSWNTIFPRIIHYHSATSLYVLALDGETNFSPEEFTFWAGTSAVDASAPSDSIVLGTWIHVAAVFDSVMGKWTLYKDGVEILVTLDPDDIQSSTLQMSIGVRNEVTGPLFHMHANVDEVRISSAARSAYWISAQHASMKDTFVTYGSEEAL